jgi:hypothetical protein
LTLVELLVVLVILAILTVLAVQSMSAVVDQSRFDATQQSLQNIQYAIVGPPNQRNPDGSLLITGFLADMGRLPLVVDTSDPLRELWDASAIPPASMYSVQPVTLDLKDATGNTIVMQLRCGWRGPYVAPPLVRQVVVGGQTLLQQKLVDAWGNPFDALDPTNSPVAVGQPVFAVRSRGADNLIDSQAVTSSAYNQDQYVPSQSYQINGTALTLQPPLSTFAASATVQVNVQALTTTSGSPVLGDPVASGSNNAVIIYLLTPVNGAVAKVPSTVTTLQASPPNPVTFTFPNVAVGPRAIQAFQYDPTTKTVFKRSPMVYLTLPSGGLPAQTLVLQ